MYPNTIWVMVALVSLLMSILYFFSDKKYRNNIQLLIAIGCAAYCAAKIIQWKMLGLI